MTMNKEISQNMLKSGTSIVGIICKDGVVLGADRRSTAGGAEMSIVMKKIGKAMIEGLGVKGYSIFLDNKDVANQHVPHVHFHLVPRKEGDNLARWSQSGYIEGEAEECLAKITEKL